MEITNVLVEILISLNFG